MFMFPRLTSRFLFVLLFLVPVIPAWSQMVEEDNGLVASGLDSVLASAEQASAGGGRLRQPASGAPGLEDSALGFVLFPDLKFDLIGSTSYIFDSNTTQSPIANSTSVFAFGLAAIAKSGDEKNRGAYYSLDYNGQAFLYTDSADDCGRDPYEHYFSGLVGVNGGKTRLRLDVDYHRNNGNSIQWDNIQRETRRAASHDYNFTLSGSRDLHRGDLLFSTGYALRDFDPGTGFGDGENTFGDLSYMTTPSFAPKSTVGLGVRFGSDDYDGQSSQDYTTPSLRWGYRLSGKTSIHNSLGYEFRSIDAPGSVESENVVYNGSINWAATSKTGFALNYYRNVLPSYVLTGEDSTNTGISLQMQNDLPGLFALTSRIGYENAEYFAGSAGASSDRDDNFARLSLELTHPLVITERIHGQWAIFYNYNQNDSNQAAFEFEQSITGIRFSLLY